jgi:hypothetical protein
VVGPRRRGDRDPRLRIPRPGSQGSPGAAVAIAALLGARAHLWEPATGIVYGLLTAALVCGVVTDE